MGPPTWKLEWFDKDGARISSELPSGTSACVIRPLSIATTPVIAWPWWPAQKALPGLYRPAGAIIPRDMDGTKISLSWESGVDAFFYLELAKYKGQREPQNFNWTDFRGLFENGSLKEAVIKDPWLVDWESIAVLTAQSGFDKRRLKPANENRLVVKTPWQGVWVRSSPFAESEFWGENDVVYLKTGARLDYWLSASGVLKASGNRWFVASWDTGG
jgi:hypothetical protein